MLFKRDMGKAGFAQLQDVTGRIQLWLKQDVLGVETFATFKDLRTGIERSDTQKVLDGDLDEFIEASLKSGLEAGSKRSDAA